MISWTYKTAFRAALLLAVAAVLDACGSQPPYVYRPNEFNRQDPNFGKTPTDISSTVICYAKWSTTPEAVRELAAQECGKYGRISVYTGKSLTYCPLRTPTAALFDCLRPGEKPAPRDDGGHRAAARPAVVPGDAPAALPEGARPLGVLLGRPSEADRR